jgi:hypothetical protein
VIALRNVFGERYADVSTATDGEYTFKLPPRESSRLGAAGVADACEKEAAQLESQIREMQRWVRILRAQA